MGVRPSNARCRCCCCCSLFSLPFLPARLFFFSLATRSPRPTRGESIIVPGRRFRCISNQTRTDSCFPNNNSNLGWTVRGWKWRLEDGWIDGFRQLVYRRKLKGVVVSERLFLVSISVPFLFPSSFNSNSSRILLLAL